MQTRSAQKKQQYPLNGKLSSADDDSQSIAASENGKAVPGAAEAPQIKQEAIMQAVQSTCALVLYLLSSSLIIILNKRLMVDDGFKFPLALTGLSQVAGALAAWIYCKMGMMKLGPAPSTHFFATRLMPIVLCAGGALYFGNVAYLSLSVAFIQILKVLTPAVTLAICAMFGLEKLTSSLLISIFMITAGTGAATAVEVGVAGFKWMGFLSFLLSVLMEAVRVVYIQLLLGKLNYNAMEVLIYLGLPTGVLLLGASAIWELEGLQAYGLSLMAHKPLHYSAAVFMGFLVNLSTAFAIKVTGSLTFKVVGCVKNTMLVWVGVLMGDVVTGTQLWGYSVSVFGFALYTYEKWQQASSKPSSVKKVA